MPRYDVVDISNNNGAISDTTYSAMKAKGVKAIIHKLSESTNFYDGYAKGNLARAKAHGMAIHGYHFARFTTVAGAQAEARWALHCATLAGLPKSSVLVLDFESNNLGWTQNLATTKAFAKIIKAAGYRYDIYTMGSWVNSVPINNGGRAGWIANYPYYATGMKLFPTYNAWQWTDHAVFNGKGFDCSVDYAGFYTKGAKAKPAKPKRTGKYFDWQPSWLLIKYDVKAYKMASAVGSGKNVVKTWRAGKSVHVKKLIKSSKSKVTRFELTDGTYITGSEDYVTNLYYTTSKHGIAGKTVVSLKGTSRYKSPKFNDKNRVDTFPKGTKFDVKKVVKVGDTTRLKLSNGLYISGNKTINRLNN